MDLIYMNANKEDIGVLMNYELDMAFGSDENTFECIVQSRDHCCQAGFFLYIEGTEYGGIIDGIQSKTGEEEVIYSGRTWHGILGSKIILPLQAGEGIPANVTAKTQDSKGNSLVNRYLIVSGDAHDCIRFMIDRCGLSSLFEVPEEASGINIKAYQFNRYTNAYKGICGMLASAGAKMKLAYKNGKIIVSAAERYDFATDDSFDSDLIDFNVTKKYKTVNHLICLGAGELENRLVIHLYADEEGNISQTQTLFGEDEYSATYDYSVVESEEELIASGTEELKGLWKQDSLYIDFDESMDAYDVGDIVGATDVVTGVSVASVITKKIVTIKNGKITIDLSTDAVSSSGGSGATGDGEAIGGGGGSIPTSVTWDSVEDKPDTFPPATHTHTAEEIGALPKKYKVTENLLDNSDFTRWVAQAGISGKHGTVTYGGDRWILDSGTVTGTANTNGNGYKNIKLNGTLRQVVTNPPETGTAFVGMVSGDATISYSDGEVTITSAGGVIKWALLVPGDIDEAPSYIPKGYGPELVECMRYFQRVNAQVPATSMTTATRYYTYNLPIPMRVAPSMTNLNIAEYQTMTATGGKGAANNLFVNLVRALVIHTISNVNYGLWVMFRCDLSADL